MSSTVDNEDDFFIDYGRKPSPFRWLAYFLVGLVTSSLPIYLYIAIVELNFVESVITISVGSVAGAVLLSRAYHNIYFSKRVKVVKENAAPTKSMFRKGSDDYGIALAAYESSCSLAALTWSFFYNNAMFLALVVSIGVYVLRGKILDEANFIVTTLGAAFFVFYNSRKAMQAIGEI